MSDIASNRPDPNYEILTARERLTDSLSNPMMFQTDIEIAKLQVLQSIAHALIAIATSTAMENDAARREARRQAFVDAEILAGRWHAVVRDTDLLAEIRARALDPLAPLSTRYVGGHLANAPQPATPAIADRNEPDPKAP